jgi:hypothetical protein
MRCRVLDAAIPSTIERKLHDLCDIFFVLQFRDAVVLPDMLYERFNVAAHGHRVAIWMARTEYAGVLSVRSASMTLHHEAVGDLEASLVSVLVLSDFPRFAG